MNYFVIFIGTECPEMKNDISIEERIDNYILGKMTAEEGGQFELDIKIDKDLVAESQLEKANTMIQKEYSSLNDSEEDEYHRQILQIKQQDAEWYSAIILMKKGKVVKAKKYLKKFITQNNTLS